MLLCARPHVKEIDFTNDTVRFIVSTASGLNVNGQHLIMGDEVPSGVLSVEALRQIYEPPLRLIETIEYVREDPGLVEACIRQGTDLALPEIDDQQRAHFVQANDQDQLVLCDQCGELVDDLTKHTKKQCKANQKKQQKNS